MCHLQYGTNIILKTVFLIIYTSTALKHILLYMASCNYVQMKKKTVFYSFLFTSEIYYFKSSINSKEAD